ncbi:MAG: NAD(P)-binding protein [Microthrixaceae bacterium]
MGDTVDERWDAVVIGSGLGGLSAAACLAGSDRRVLVLERHDIAGGNATVFRRHHEGDEYEFDVGVHYIGECQQGGVIPAILDGLGVGDRITFRPFDQDQFDTLVMPDLEVKIPAGWDDYIANVVEAVPGDRAAVERCMTTLRDVARESRERLIPGADTPVFDEWSYRPLSELFDECELSPTARAIIDHWNGLYAGAPSQTAVVMHAVIADHYMSGAYYPEGGGQVIPAAARAGDRGQRRRGAHTGPCGQGPGPRSARAGGGAGGRHGHSDGPGRVERGSHPHGPQPGRPRALGPGNAALRGRGAHDVGPGGRVRGRRG